MVHVRVFGWGESKRRMACFFLKADMLERGGGRCEVLKMVKWPLGDSFGGCRELVP